MLSCLSNVFASFYSKDLLTFEFLLELGNLQVYDIVTIVTNYVRYIAQMDLPQTFVLCIYIIIKSYVKGNGTVKYNKHV